MTTLKNQKIIVIEGNIGAGKSTFLKLLSKTLNAHLVNEPLEKWQNVEGGNILDHFYKDTRRWAYTFQSYAFITRVLALEEQLKMTNKPIIVLERSVYSDRYCFAKNCFELGLMSALEWSLYQEWFEWLMAHYHNQPDAFVYLQTDPIVCYQRLLKRSRSEESDVSLEYLTMLHNKHENWLLKKKDLTDYVKAIPVLTLECNQDFEHTPMQFKRHIDTLVEFLTFKFSVPPVNLRQNQLNL